MDVAGPRQTSRRLRLSQRYDMQQVSSIIKPILMQERPKQPGGLIYLSKVISPIVTCLDLS